MSVGQSRLAAAFQFSLVARRYRRRRRSVRAPQSPPNLQKPDREITMATAALRLFTRRQLQYCSAPKCSFAGGLAASVRSSYSTKKVPPTNKMSLPQVFFDMTADGEPVGRITIEVSETLFLDSRSVLSAAVQPSTTLGIIPSIVFRLENAVLMSPKRRIFSYFSSP